ncbi:MAG: nucleotide synthetase [Pseudomonadota bacterium]
MNQKDVPIEYITVVRLTFDATDTTLEFTLSDAEIHRETDIKKFLKQLVKKPPPKPWGTKAPDPNSDSHLGIPVDAPTHVIVVLDPDKAWQFRDGKPAITAKRAYGDQNHGAWHVDDSGNRLSDFPEGCTIAYFTVVSRPPKGEPDAVQGFNFHVEFLQKNGKWAEIAIDPDVPETGTEGFPSKITNRKSLGGSSKKNSLTVYL